jgi:hypothetical protein
MSISMYAERLVVAVSRRLGDELHPWLLNGDLRPKGVAHDYVLQGIYSEE